MYITHLKYNGFPHLRAPHKNRQRSTSGISLVYLKSTKRSRWIIFKTNREHLLGSTFKWLMVVIGWVCFYFSVFLKVTGCFQKEPHTVHTIMNPYVNIFVFYIFLNIVQCKNSTSSPRQPYCGLPFHWESWSLPWIYTTCFHTSYIFSGKVFLKNIFFIITN